MQDHAHQIFIAAFTAFCGLQKLFCFASVNLAENVSVMHGVMCGNSVADLHNPLGNL